MQVFSITDENAEMRAAKVLPTEHARREIIGLNATHHCRFALKMIHHMVSSPNLAELHRCVSTSMCDEMCWM